MNNKSKQYKYNEREYAKLIYNKGFQTKYFKTELKLLALYLRDIGLTVKQRTEYIYDFCRKYIPEFHEAQYFGLLDSAIKYSQNKNRQFVNIDSIPIYKAEIDYINGITDVDYNSKRVLFTLLVQKKLDNLTYYYRNGKESKSINFKGGNQKYNKLKQMANIPKNIKINDEIVYNLNELGYIEIKYAGLIKLTYINNIQYKENDEIIIEVINYDKTGLYFDYYNNLDKVRLCKYCNEPFIQTASNQQYCEEHKGYQPKETKTIICVDCGKEVEIDGYIKNKYRCNDCQNIKNKERYIKYNKKR
jgi:DNA-directed RNA polymerase subunit RPC12/RpoP